MFFRAGEIEKLVRWFGVAVTINGRSVTALYEERGVPVVEGFATSGIGRMVLITTSAEDQGAIGEPIVVGAATFTIRDLVSFGDGGVVGAVCERVI